MLAVIASCAWFMLHVPPNCSDPHTVGLVEDALKGRYHLPQTTELSDIHTLGGGMLALRFVCEAELAGFDRSAVPPGPIPHAVHYASWVADHRHHVVVSVAPELTWEKVQ